jgi:allantoate deiminase
LSRFQTASIAATARRVVAECRALASYTEEPGFTTRRFLSPPMHGVHAHLRAWTTGLGMATRVDAVGNLRGVRAAATANAPTLYIGSHLDSVPHAGAFDGVLGVVMGVALVELLGTERLPFHLEVIGFSDEEGVRFGVPFIGSRALVGTVDETLLGRHDDGGVTVAEAIRVFGLDPALRNDAAISGDGVAYLEFHIEQGPILEAMGLPLGVVDAIVGRTSGVMQFSGQANHAGTTPMNRRRDAVAGAAEWILEVERHAQQTTALVATVGRITVSPDASNVIAGECSCTLDVRHRDDGARAASVEHLVDSARQVATSRGIGVTWTPQLDQMTVAMNPRLVAALARAVAQTGATVHHMTSGAGHDAMILAPRLPAAMLFVRSPGGISHHPDEAVLEDDVAAALRAGIALVTALAASHD